MTIFWFENSVKSIRNI